jgi:hypothetical protein
MRFLQNGDAGLFMEISPKRVLRAELALGWYGGKDICFTAFNL